MPSPTERAAPWNAATEAAPYSRADFDRDTAGLDVAADGLAYLEALDDGYKRFMAANWNPALPYDRLPPELRYNSEALLPPPPPADTAHHFDGLPTGTIIEKTEGGFALHPQGTATTRPTDAPPAQIHVGGFNGFLHKVLHWLHLG